MVSPEQSRAARGWLGWSQGDLAKRADVALSTVRDFERGRRTPIQNNLAAMRDAFASAGVYMQMSDGGRPVGIMVVQVIAQSGAQIQKPSENRR